MSSAKKVASYITGLIKKVEQFSKVMSDKWILRIYYDSIFDETINYKDLDRHFDQEQFIYNTNIYEPKSNNNQNVKDAKVNIKKYKTFLKKIIKLFKLYLGHLKYSKLDKYKNIELISYDCSLLKTNGFVGHPSTFGSIMRFLPIYDKDVSLFVSVNSRDIMTPLQTDIIYDWEKSDKTVMGILYSAGFLEEKYNYMNKVIDTIKKK